VDLDAVLAHSLDETVDFLIDQTRNGALDPFLSLIVRGLADGSPQNRAFLKAFLASETRTFINAGISRGIFAGTGGDRADLPPLFQGISRGRKEILPGKIRSRKNGRVTVSAAFLDRGAGRFPLRLAVENAGGRWRITKILNTSELVQEALRHAR
jgi:hypothetical protein